MGGMYEFNPDDARRFATEIGADAREYHGELFFKQCPYCRGEGKRNERTFSINLKTGQFHCFRSGCGVSGNMITLSRDFDFDLGDDIDEYYRPKREFQKIKQPDKPYKSKDKAIQYMKSRNISEDITYQYEITVRNDRDNVIVFPFYDEKGTLQYIKYRKTDFDPEHDSAKEWSEKNCKPILFGMKQCNDTFDRLVITEGQMDSLSVAAAGIENAVSVPNGAKGFTWFPYCYDWLRKFKEIVVFGDFEKGSMTLLDDLKRRCPNRIKYVTEEYYKGCKDANDILRQYGREAVRNAVENAVDIPIAKVIPLDEVEDVDIYKLPKLKTGISQLDKTLYGGLPFGEVCVLSGKRGEGKSTFASQIMLNAVDQGYTVFTYSGEMPDYLYKSWFDFQAAGGNHILENQSISGQIDRFISNKNKELIHSWYRGKAYIYDNSRFNLDSDDEESKASLLETIEKTIQRYDVKVILLDNLMTAMYLDGKFSDDKYAQQGYFVQRLTKLALKYNVLIILIAHQRKSEKKGRDTDVDFNEEIMGAGEISNLAGITLTYKRDKDTSQDKRKLIVSKNRLFGKTNLNGIVLNYDEKSKRIYGEGDDQNFNYGWDKSDGFEPSDDFIDIPFD